MSKNDIAVLLVEDDFSFGAHSQYTSSYFAGNQKFKR